MSYEDYILHHRVFCDACTSTIPAIRVLRINGKEHALCFKHYHQLKPTTQKEPTCPTTQQQQQSK